MNRLREAAGRTKNPDELWAAELLRSIDPIAPSEAHVRARAADLAGRRRQREQLRWRRPAFAGVAVLIAATAAAGVAYRVLRTPEHRGKVAADKARAGSARLGSRSVPALARGLQAPSPPVAPNGTADALDTSAGAAAPTTAPASAPGINVPRFSFAAGFETGDLSEWLAEKSGLGTGSKRGPLTYEQIVESPARSGRYALKLSVDTTDTAELTRLVYNWLDDKLPAEGYYSVWYFFPQRFESPHFWSVWIFRGRTDPADPATVYANMWGLVVNNRSDGEMVFRLADRRRNNKHWEQEKPVAIPVGRWVHVECYFKRAADRTGRIVFWQDGVKIFDFKDLSTAPSDYHSWVVGSVARRVSPSPAVLFIDDVSASTWPADQPAP